MISEKKKKKKNQKSKNIPDFTVFFGPKINILQTAHNPRSGVNHGLKAPTAWRRQPPSEGESHPSLNRWLTVPIPTDWRWTTTKAAGLEVTHGGLPCPFPRTGGDPRPRLPVWRWPTAKPAAWGCRAHRNEFCSGVVSQSRLFTGFLKFLGLVAAVMRN